MLSEWDLADYVSYDELREMGWNGRVLKEGKIYYLNQEN